MRSVKFKEYKWQAYILAAINSPEWQNRWEVEARIAAIMPPEAMHRAHERYWNGNRTLNSFRSTLIGASIRALVRNGYIERSIPIASTVANVGNYSLRLTKKGAKRRERIRHYFCASCFNSGVSVPRLEEHIICGQCRGRKLTITKL